MREKEFGTITIVLIGGHLENNCQNNDSFVRSGTTQFRRAVTVSIIHWSMQLVRPFCFFFTSRVAHYLFLIERDRM